MHQDRKMARSASADDVDIKPPFSRHMNELRRNTKQKQGPNYPKEEMMRSHSESWINIRIVRSGMKHSQSSSCYHDKGAGVICSNEDFKKILQAKRHQYSRKRDNTLVCQLEPTPEVPTEADVQFDKLSEEAKSAPSPRVLKRVTMLPMRQCAGSEPTSPANHSKSKRKMFRLSPILLRKNNSNIFNNRNSGHVSSKAMSSRRATSNGLCGDLDSTNKKETSLIEETGFVDEPMIEVENKNILRDSDNKNDHCLPSSESAFDPQLLGEAIERHLAMQKQTSPGRRSPRFSKTILGQSNSQISSRLGSLISRFPFKRDGSVSPTHCDGDMIF